MPPAADAMTIGLPGCAVERDREVELLRRCRAASSISTFCTFWPSGPVCGVTQLHAEDLRRPTARASSGDSASLTPPPLPRPPAWICALTTQRPPSSSQIDARLAGVVGHPAARRRARRSGAGSPWPGTRGSSRALLVRNHPQMARRVYQCETSTALRSLGTGVESDRRMASTPDLGAMRRLPGELYELRAPPADPRLSNAGSGAHPRRAAHLEHVPHRLAVDRPRGVHPDLHARRRAWSRAA